MNHISNTIYTIGHSNHPPEVLVRLLKESAIEVVVDVRGNPASTWVTYATPQGLKQILKAAGIQYLYMGDLLGGRPDDAACYTEAGKADYRTMQQRASFREGLKRLVEVLRKYRVSIMCAEEDPSSCHRHLLVGEGLRGEGTRILHIRGNGQIQTDDDLRKEKAGVPPNQLLLPL
ncbi:MAG: DUF488 domain-containing protein [Chloroflexi bacterium]|nr:DUF488 domain-containing protein [Chloroflexota bacterium]